MSTIIYYDRFSCGVLKTSTGKLVIEFQPDLEHQERKCFFVKNISEEPQIIKVESPLTQFFHIDFSILNNILMPNHSVEISVTCSSKLGKRPYYDQVKILCNKGCGLTVRLVATPDRTSIIEIPKKIHFGTVPLGESMTAFITIPPVQKKVPFMIVCSNSSPGLNIQPLKGVVESKEVKIQITYKAIAYVTVSFPIHIYLPTLNELPYFLVVTADSKPGLIGSLMSHAPCLSDTPCKIEHIKTKLVDLKPKDKLVQKDMSWSNHATNLFLLKKDWDDTETHTILGPLGRPVSTEEKTKKSKEQDFLKRVEYIKKKNSEAYLHTRDVLLSSELEIDGENWKNKWAAYKEDKDGTRSELLRTTHTQFIRKRIIRYVQNPSTIENDNTVLSFTNRTPNPWFVRSIILGRFVNAARTVLIHQRLLKRLEILKRLIPKSKCRKYFAAL